MRELDRAGELAEAGNHEEALRIASKLLDDNFDDPKVLFLVGYILIQTEKPGLAFQMLKRASDVSPSVAAIWVNMGKCFHERQQDKEAEACFRRCLKIKPDHALALNNLALVYMNRAEYGQAMEYANRALKSDPSLEDARINLGFCRVALRDWGGWEDYNRNIGKLKDRQERVYGDEPRWSGEKGKTVVVTGEQGIGDEISFASCIPDLMRDSKRVIIESDKRLEGLFARSFPGTTVYGTRYKTDIDWHEREEFDARVQVGALPQFYRQKDEDFPGTPYLVACPEKRIQWRALLDSLGPRLKVGLAWIGGRPHTFKSRRSVTLDTLRPLFECDADFISLQYKDTEDIQPFRAKYGVRLHHWDWGVEAYDYDQTAALVAELDLVISVTTTVVHLAGGLGKECWCLVPDKPMWRYGIKGDDLPWAKSVTLYRQKGREWPMHILASKLRERCR